jgi:DNA-binding response OmpR family regulator
LLPFLPQISIMIVEDEPLIAYGLEMMLVDSGANVMGVCTSPQEAFSLLETKTPDFVLLDLVLRGEFGISLARELARRSIPFAFTTGAASDDRIPPELRNYPVLLKPYEPDTLVALVSSLTKQAEPPLEL